MSSFGFYDPANSVANPYGTAKGGPARVTMIAPDQYVDEQNNMWTGSWENPVQIQNTSQTNPGIGATIPPGNPATPLGKGPAPTGPGPSFVGDTYLNGKPTIQTTRDTNPGMASLGLTIPPPDHSGAVIDAPASGGGSTNTSDPTAFIRQWQASHPVSEGMGPLLTALQQAGYNASPFMYGSTASHNEITLNGQKFKLIGAEDSPGAFWYTGGNDAPSGGGGTSGGGGDSLYTWNQAIDLANQHAGHTLSDTEIKNLLTQFGGTVGSSVSKSGLQPVLDYLDAHKGGSGGPKPPPPTPNPPPGTYGGPGDPGVFNGPTQQVGQDPLSLLTSQVLAGLMLNGGRVTSGIGAQGQSALSQMLGSGNLNNRLESIREQMASLQHTQMNDARGELASRGLLSEGSTAQGPEMSTLGRIEQNIAPIWSGAARDAITQDDTNLMSAIQTATGLDESAANRLLATTQTVGDRQQMLSNIALKSLEDNQSWNEFIAQYGLDRDKLEYDIQNNQTAQLIPLLQQFLGWFNGTTGGFV